MAPVFRCLGIACRVVNGMVAAGGRWARQSEAPNRGRPSDGRPSPIKPAGTVAVPAE